MSGLEQERSDLRLADRHIVEGESRIAQQEALVGRLESEGFPAPEGERLLQTLRETLQLWRQHRTQILMRIGYLEAERLHASTARAHPKTPPPLHRG